MPRDPPFVSLAIPLWILILSAPAQGDPLMERACSLEYERCTAPIIECRDAITACDDRVESCGLEFDRRVNECSVKSNVAYVRCLNSGPNTDNSAACQHLRLDCWGRGRAFECGTYDQCRSGPACDNPELCTVKYELCMRDAVESAQSRTEPVRQRPAPTAPAPQPAPQPAPNTPSLSLDEQLLAAVRGKTPNNVESLVRAGADPNKIHDWVTPLTASLHAGNYRAADSLLSNGADINLGNETTPSAIMVAAAKADIKMVKWVLDAGGYPNDTSGYGRDFRKGSTPLHLAMESGGSAEIARLLVEAGADVNTPRINYALLPVEVAKDPAAQRYLIEAGTYPQIALESAIALGDLALVQDLVGKGANVDGKQIFNTRAKIRPLLIAAREGKHEIMNYLIENGASLKDAHELVMAAIQSGDRLILTRLFEAGAGPPHPIALVHAISGDQVEMVEILLKAGMDPNSVQGRTQHRDRPAYFMAVEVSGPIAMLRSLLDHGADVGYADSKGTTALHIAAERGLAEHAALLLSKGADPKARNKERKTALAIAKSRHKNNRSLIATLKP